MTCLSSYNILKDQQVTRTRTRQQNKPLTRHTNTERATAQRRLIVEDVVAAPKLPPSAALLRGIDCSHHVVYFRWLSSILSWGAASP